MIHTGKEAAAGKSAVQRKIVVKYLFFTRKANAKLVNAFQKQAKKQAENIAHLSKKMNEEAS